MKFVQLKFIKKILQPSHSYRNPKHKAAFYELNGIYDMRNIVCSI
jgi:hypothetical protein